MKPYFSADNYEYCLSDVRISTDVGEKGVIAFRSFDESVYVGDISSVMKYRDANRVEFSNYPLLDLQLARICGEAVSALYEKWRSAAKLYFNGKEINSWCDGELALFQKNGAIWRSINSEKIKYEAEIHEVFGSHSFEYIFRWLVANMDHNNWPNVWVKAFKMYPFDERLHAIANKWLVSAMGSGVYIGELRLILYCHLEYIGGENISDIDFSEVFTEYVLSLGQDLSYVLYPNDFPYLVVSNLDFEREEKSVNSFVAAIIDRISGDVRYASTLGKIEKHIK